MYDCMPVCNVYECMWNVCMNVQTQFLASKYVFVGRVRALVDWFPGIAVELMKTAGASPSRFWANLVHRQIIIKPSAKKTSDAKVISSFWTHSQQTAAVAFQLSRLLSSNLQSSHFFCFLGSRQVSELLVFFSVVNREKGNKLVFSLPFETWFHVLIPPGLTPGK